jgi:hypothetical protein
MGIDVDKVRWLIEMVKLLLLDSWPDGHRHHDGYRHHHYLHGQNGTH